MPLFPVAGEQRAIECIFKGVWDPTQGRTVVVS